MILMKATTNKHEQTLHEIIETIAEGTINFMEFDRLPFDLTPYSCYGCSGLIKGDLVRVYEIRTDTYLRRYYFHPSFPESMNRV